MALTIGQKCGRVLTFLRGVRHPRVFGALAAHGFDRSDLEDGWSLLRAACDIKLGTRAVTPVPPGVYDALDAWENKWFPISSATLTRHHPTVAEKVFLNLRQTKGVEVSISVNAFTKRIRALEQSRAKGDGAARELLSRRGLTEAVMREAETLLKSLEREAATPLPPEPSDEEVKAAERAMWAWYLEWSALTRLAIHDRRLLRSLGFLTSSGAEVSPDEPSEADAIDLEEVEEAAAA